MSNDTLKAPSQLSAHSRIFQLISIPKLFAWEMCAARTMYKLYSRSTKNYLDCVPSHSHGTWDSNSLVTQISSSTAEIAVILRQALQVVLHEAFGRNQRSTSLPRSTSDSVSPLTLISCRLPQTELQGQCQKQDMILRKETAVKKCAQPTFKVSIYL